MSASSLIASGDIDFGEITNTSNLHIIRSLDKMDTLECVIRNRSAAASRLCAPRYFNALRIADCTLIRRRPEAEVVDVTVTSCEE
jgi:hypothetical protein